MASFVRLLACVSAAVPDRTRVGLDGPASRGHCDCVTIIASVSIRATSLPDRFARKRRARRRDDAISSAVGCSLPDPRSSWMSCGTTTRPLSCFATCSTSSRPPHVRLLFRGLTKLDYPRGYADAGSDPISRYMLLLGGFAPEQRRASEIDRPRLLRLPLFALHRNGGAPSTALADMLEEALDEARSRWSSMLRAATSSSAKVLAAARSELSAGRRRHARSARGRAREQGPDSHRPPQPRGLRSLAPGGAAYPRLRRPRRTSMLPESVDYDIELTPVSVSPLASDAPRVTTGSLVGGCGSDTRPPSSHRFEGSPVR